MKEEHIDLVERMQDAYKEIEEESKVNKSTHLIFKSIMWLVNQLNCIGSVQRVCSATEEAAWLQDGSL